MSIEIDDAVAADALDGTEELPSNQGGQNRKITVQQIADFIGGDVSGQPVVRKRAFSFDTPDLATGAAVYIPTIGDVLINAWIEVDTAWDGATPKADIGLIDTPNFSIGLTSFVTDLTVADSSDVETTGLHDFLVGQGGPSFLLDNLSSRRLPGKFLTTDSLKLYVVDAVPNWPIVHGDNDSTLPLTVVANVNDKFRLTRGGGLGAPETFTIAPGTYSTIDDVCAAMSASLGSGSGERFDTLCFVDPTGGGSPHKIDVTMRQFGSAGNGNTLTPGATHDVLASLGFSTNPAIFAFGSGDDPGATQGEGILYLVTATPFAG